MTEFIKFAFSAGEISPTLAGRTDLEKYDLGLGLAHNWFVDYRGGLSTRPGTIFLDYLWKDHLPIRLVPFQYAPNVANSYVLVFGDYYIRFVQDGAYVLEAGHDILSISQANPGAVWAPGHGLASGDWVKLTGMSGMRQLYNRTVQVIVVDANTFQLSDAYGVWINTTTYEPYVSGGQVSRIYTLASPYVATSLDRLHFHQYRDLIRITSPDYDIVELVRYGDTNWTLAATSFGADIGQVTNVTTEVEQVGPNYFAFSVTAVNEDGEESVGIVPVVSQPSYDPANSDENRIDVFWYPVVGAKYYNVYASRRSREYDEIRGAEVGFVGRTYSTHFQYVNIIPDFTKTPPQHFDPFADGAVYHVDVTNAGAGYTSHPVVEVTGGGTGWMGYTTIDKFGQVTSVVTLYAGKNYSAPVVTIWGGGGAGATGVAYATPMSGNNPHLSTIFQQRQIYAASANKPLTIWGSKPKIFNNFDISQVVLDNDSYEFELDAEEVTPIKHLKPVRGGLLVFTDEGLWLLTGGGMNDPITPTNVLAQPNTYKGISDVPPIGLDTDLIYIESRGYTARLLTFNDVTRVYAGEDISIFSNHFFSSSNYVTEWSYADDPHKLVWARRQNGSLLALTAVKEQKLFAWTQHWTKGLFERVLTVREGVTDRTYVVVSRAIGPRIVKYLESFAGRHFAATEEAFCVDSGLSLGRTYPNATLYNEGLNVATQEITVVTSSGIFFFTDVGKVIRASGGKYRVKTVESSTRAVCDVLRQPTIVFPELGEAVWPIWAAPGTWTLDRGVTSIGGLWHLEGQVVNALVDGNVVLGLTVTNGEVLLPFAGTMVHIGLAYSCRAKTLPLTTQEGIVENNRVSVKGILGRFYETAGLRFGTSPDKVRYEIPVRMNEIPGEPTELLTGKKQVMLPPDLGGDGEIYINQDYPLPASLLGFVTDVELGDDES